MNDAKDNEQPTFGASAYFTPERAEYNRLKNQRLREVLRRLAERSRAEPKPTD